MVQSYSLRSIKSVPVGEAILKSRVILGSVDIHAMTACKWRFSPLPVLMNEYVHCAPVLENHHSRLALTSNLGGP
jgi:hypothetical protein